MKLLRACVSSEAWVYGEARICGEEVCSSRIALYVDKNMNDYLYSLTYTEGHPDRDQTFLGIFSSEEKAKEAMQKHMMQEKARLPYASIGEWNYRFDEAILDKGA